MMKFKESLKGIRNRLSDWILLAYVIWFIKLEVFRGKAEDWVFLQNEKIKERS